MTQHQTRQRDSTPTARTITIPIEIKPTIALDLKPRLSKPVALRQSSGILAAVGVGSIVDGSGINRFLEAVSMVGLWQRGFGVSPDFEM